MKTPNNPNAPGGHPLYLMALRDMGRPPDVVIVRTCRAGFFGFFPMPAFPTGGAIDVDGRDFGPAANDE